MIKLNQYPAAFLKTAIDAIDLSRELVKEWLGTCMYDKTKAEDIPIIENIVNELNEHDKSKNHGRHLGLDFCKKIGLKIMAMESDNQLQDAILSVHHAYMITLESTGAIKIIENSNGKALINGIAK